MEQQNSQKKSKFQLSVENHGKEKKSFMHLVGALTLTVSGELSTSRPTHVTRIYVWIFLQDTLNFMY